MPYREFTLQPSMQCLLLIGSVLVASAVLILMLPCGWLLKMALMVGLVFYGGYLIFQLGLLRGKNAIHRLVCSENGWRVQTNRQVSEARLRGDSTVTQWVSVLRFNIPAHYWPVSCVIFRDSILHDDYRNFLIHLKAM